MPLRYMLSSQLMYNIRFHLNRLFINNGLYFNVPSGSLGINGERIDVLKRVNSKIYESAFDQWIYEKDGIGVSPYNTIIASGVSVNGAFSLSGSGAYKPSIDYNNGRVLFANPVPSNARVSAEFSYKHVLVDFPDSRRINQIFSKFKDSIDFTNNVYPSGFQKQLPAIVIDVQNRITSPFSLGGAKQHNTLIVFHVLANTEHEMNLIVDLLTERASRTVIKGVDFNKTPQLFTSQGDKATTYQSYTELQSNILYAFPQIYIDDVSLVNKNDIRGVWFGQVNWKTLIIANLTP